MSRTNLWLSIITASLPIVAVFIRSPSPGVEGGAPLSNYIMTLVFSELCDSGHVMAGCGVRTARRGAVGGGRERKPPAGLAVWGVEGGAPLSNYIMTLVFSELCDSGHVMAGCGVRTARRGAFGGLDAGKLASCAGSHEAVICSTAELPWDARTYNSKSGSTGGKP